MTDLRNTTIYTTVERWPEGDLINGSGNEPFGSIAGVATHIATEEDGHYATIILVTAITYDDEGRVTYEDVSAAVAHVVAKLYDDPDVDTLERFHVSPLVTGHTEWELPDDEDPYAGERSVAEDNKLLPSELL